MLAELQRSEGAKFVTLAHRLGVSSAALRQTLDELIVRGWVRRNPGYGHPLRPEYVLTTAGARRAPVCRELDDILTTRNLRYVGLKQWSMPALFAIGDHARRFSELVERLRGATDRAVALTLKDLGQASLIARQVLDTFPPAAAYSATRAGQRLVPILARL